MRLEDMGLVIYQEYLPVASMVSLLSVWVLVGLFFCLNRYKRSDFFNIWTGAWLFYALWMTLSVLVEDNDPESLAFTIKQCFLSLSAVFLCWGSLRFLGLPVGPRLLSAFIVFLMAWIVVSSQVLLSAVLAKLPVFMLLGLGTPFAGLCYLRLQRQKALVGTGMLSLGILLWGVYFGSYPYALQYQSLYGAGFLGAAVLQFLIAAVMIALVLEEIRSSAELVSAEAAAVRLKKDDSQIKVITAREESQSLHGGRVTEGTQKAYKELRRTQQAVVQQERLLALGQMVTGVADDINHALTPITAYSELLLSTLPDLADAPQQRLEKISRAADDVAQIVTRLREIYRRDLEPDQLGKGTDLTAPRRRDLAQREGTSLHTKFERLLLECSGDFSMAQSNLDGPARWFSLRK
jgi:signal transduction histidine kinase